MRYAEIITEVFDNPPTLLNIKNQSDEWKADFDVGEERYQAYAFNNDDEHWIFEFRYTQAKRLSNTYDLAYGNNGKSGRKSLAVFAGAIQALKTFIKTKMPIYVHFDGKKSLKKDALYNKMLRAMQRDIDSAGYRVRQVDNGEDVEFTLVRI